ncbi:MAG: type II toxin-antitoxin system VapC family toxin [Deltaproteobacteria bacterium]|nr:type II toxin-antitoxin system VapC family toxin [Deltaproteobacteria bacterium]
MRRRAGPAARFLARARQAIADGKNTVLVTAVSVREIRIKQALGKVKLPRNFRAVLDAQPFSSLPVTAEHTHAVAGLPAVHRDPFDRMLVAQAKTESFALVSHDPVMIRYGVEVIW